MSTTIKNTKKGTTTNGSKSSTSPASSAELASDMLDREKDESKVQELNQELMTLRKKSALLTAKLGRILSKLKEQTPHGQWETYVEKHLGIPRRTANEYMNIWKRLQNIDGWEELFKTANLAVLNVSELKAELSELEKSEESHPDSKKNGDSRVTMKDTDIPKKPSPPPFRLSD